jgi:hypothetical protein
MCYHARMASSYMVYIDESGDEGFNFSGPRNSSEWFILSAAVLRRSAETELLHMWRQVRQDLGKPHGYTLHFRCLKHEQRVAVASRVAYGRLRAISVICHKPSLTDTEYLRTKSALYFYLSRYLFERISWLCRDARIPDDGDGSAQIIFSNRSGMSYDSIQEYLQRLQAKSQAGGDIQIDWAVIKAEHLTAVPHRLRDGLQVADAIASSLWQAFEVNRYGFTEDRYARELMRITYRKNNRKDEKAIGYGIKVWPGEKLAVMKSDHRYDWLFTP